MVFLDVEMPEMDGFEVGRRIYENNPECKLIIATGRVERFKEAFKIHAYRFITKPFQQDEVNDVIEAVTIGRCYRRDLPLCEIEKLLDEQLFFRINKQYIVNLSYITDYKNNTAYIGEDTFNVARRRQKEFMQFFWDLLKIEDKR